MIDDVAKFLPREFLPTKAQLEEAAEGEFYDRAEALRAEFGAWDWTDPVAKAILDLVMVQNRLTRMFSEEVDGVHNPNDPTTFDSLFRARVIVARRLLQTTIHEENYWNSLGRGK
jgi:hypothetical protein